MIAFDWQPITFFIIVLHSDLKSKWNCYPSYKPKDNKEKKKKKQEQKHKRLDASLEPLLLREAAKIHA